MLLDQTASRISKMFEKLSFIFCASLLELVSDTAFRLDIDISVDLVIGSVLKRDFDI